MIPPLPIDAVLPPLLTALAETGRAVLQAPPGAGKTTKVPLALLEAPWCNDGRRNGGRIIMLEPRRIAARAAAARMAALLGEEVGETVGYRVRLDSRVGPRTRIEVVTEGLFIRQLQDDPSLDGVAAVLFDEFHERSLDADLALALLLDARAALCPDLRVLVMSATLDGAAVAALLDDAPIITSEGRAFPVETRYLPPSALSRDGRIEGAMAAAIRQALREETGDILAFLPGTGEIRRTESILRDSVSEADEPGLVILPLHGDLPLADQDRAIAPARPGQRKIVLATAIAETSLTIDGTRIVIDSGLARVPSFDPASGMTRLLTQRVSLASADQRRGRAGRLEPGVCYRLWPEPETRALPAFRPPEITAADLSPLVLELAAWGVTDLDRTDSALRWLTPPPPAALAQARTLLQGLEALDETGAITAHGRALLRFGAHPRLAHLMVAGAALGHGRIACLLAAMLGERDPFRGDAARQSVDLRSRLDALGSDSAGHSGGPLDRAAAQRIRRQAKLWERSLGQNSTEMGEEWQTAGLLLSLAYPDRIAQNRGTEVVQGSRAASGFLLSGGRGAVLDKTDPLSAEPFLVVAALDGGQRDARIFLAAPVSQAGLEELHAARLTSRDLIDWDDRSGQVLARRQRCLGALVLEDRPLPAPDPEALARAMLTGLRRLDLACLPWTERLQTWRNRVAFLRRHDPAGGWPDLSDAALLDGLEEWLAPLLDGATRPAHLHRIDLHSALTGLIPWDRRAALDSLAPTHITVPTGNRIPVDYSGEEPVLAVRLQELFGLAETPRILGGRMPVLLHLLSPARRPVQVTRDLASFWRNAYAEVRKDLRGQYPRHYWPDNPLEAEPTARAKPRGT